VEEFKKEITVVMEGGKDAMNTRFVADDIPGDRE
jgi:hypothetical protein